ncbi:molybdate ABC transporter permease subunit [Candidatus Sumerlaeota bacterium]|nr:molybdate ABC transporter permease subunit [Candidatus Sumerlaeota bacterium]
MFAHEHFTFPLLLSLQVSALATMLAGLVGLALGYLLARGRFVGREVLDVLVTLPLVLPPVVTGYLLLMLLGRHGWLGGPLAHLGIEILFTWKAAVIASAAAALPFMVKTSRAAIEQVDPELEATAHLLGFSRWGTLWHVTLPLARQGIFAGLVLCFARAMGEFGATLMLAGNTPGRTNTVALEIYAATEAGESRRAAVLVVFLVVLSFAILYTANRLGPRSDH